MTRRKKKILSIQILLFIVGATFFYLTYNYKKNPKIVSPKKIIKSVNEENAKKNSDEIKNWFTDVEYRGLDLNGNRYKIEAKESEFNIDKPEVIYMKKVKATFFFKDDTILYLDADNGIYNNKLNDMNFSSNVYVDYIDNKLTADNLDFLNSKNTLTVYNNVNGKNNRGKIRADKLIFDLSKQTLDISMFADEQINVNLNNL